MMKLFIALVAVTAMLMPSVASANLLSNAGFEDATNSPWNVYLSDGNTGVFTYGDAGTGIGGTKSLKFDFNSYNNWGMGEYNQTVAVSAGTEYTIETWAKTNAITNAEAFIAYEYVGLGGYTESSKLTGTNDWTKLLLTSTAPVGATQMQIKLKNFATTTDPSTGQVYWDNAAINGPIPEPTSMLLLGSGLIGLLGFGRKKLIK